MITSVLSLIALYLIASLVMMVMLASYENFVSGFAIEGFKYKPSWISHIDFGELKGRRAIASWGGVSAFSSHSSSAPCPAERK